MDVYKLQFFASMFTLTANMKDHANTRLLQSMTKQVKKSGAEANSKHYCRAKNVSSPKIFALLGKKKVEI